MEPTQNSSFLPSVRPFHSGFLYSSVYRVDDVRVGAICENLGNQRQTPTSTSRLLLRVARRYENIQGSCAKLHPVCYTLANLKLKCHHRISCVAIRPCVVRGTPSRPHHKEQEREEEDKVVVIKWERQRIRHPQYQELMMKRSDVGICLSLIFLQHLLLLLLLSLLVP